MLNGDMKKPLPPITWFRAFDAAARHLSFTLAAEELGFTQSAISQHVRALEDTLGTPLFVRKHRALHLTEAGRLLVPDVAAAMAQLEQATERFVPATTRPKLTIATSVSIAQWVITPRLSEFTTLHPEIALQISTTIWPDDFAATTADIEIRFGRQEVVGRSAKLIAPSYLHAVARPDVVRGFSPSDLKRHTLIQPVGLTSGWDVLAKTGGVTDKLAPAIFVDTHGFATDLARSGTGIALSHCQITAHGIACGELAPLPLPHIPAEEGYYLAVNPSRNEELQEVFVDWFSKVTSIEVRKA